MRLNTYPATPLASRDKSISWGFLEGCALERQQGWLEAWDEEYEKKRIIRRDKFWDEFFVKHFGEDYVGRDSSLVNSNSGS